MRLCRLNHPPDHLNDYQLWRAALLHFYDPVPTVDHFVDVLCG